MPIHSVIVASSIGNVLLTRYFDLSMTLPQNSGNKQALFEQHLFKHTAIYWPTLADGHTRAVTFGSVVVVFKQISDLMIFVNGTDEIDEIILEDVLSALQQLLNEILDQKISEVFLLLPENFGKFLVAIDELMPQGIIESLDAELINKLSKMKNINY